MSDDSQAEKQLFLRNEIIDQGYNPGAWSNYMGSLRGENGLDLETWSFQDLQKVVNDFKSQMAQHQQNQAEMPPQQNESQNQEQEQNVQQNQEQDIEGAVKDNTVPEKAEQKPVTNSKIPDITPFNALASLLTPIHFITKKATAAAF